MQIRHTTGFVSFEVADDSPVVKSILIREAEEAHAQYPQYEGYWNGDEWYVVRFTRELTTKGGVRFKVGDLALCRDRSDDEARYGLEMPTAYSSRGQVNCAVPRGYFERVSA